MRIAFAAGDVGGARAILPVARLAQSLGHEVLAMRHGPFAAEGATEWTWHPPATFTDPAFWRSGPQALVFATSVSDAAALEAAAQAAARGLPLVHVLDNWSTYARRLERPSGQIVQPDRYAVMDDLARDGALAEGLPPAMLRITGHPGLAGLADEIARLPGPQVGAERRLMFVSEPARADSGGPQAPGWRGYDEDDVSTLFAALLASEGAQGVQVDVCPHPREDRNIVAQRWDALAARHGFSVEIVAPAFVRSALHRAHGVVGMTSILLYEAWLMDKPVLSLQPGLRIEALRALSRRNGLLFCTDLATSSHAMGQWFAATSTPLSRLTESVRQHRGAPAAVLDLVLDLVRGTESVLPAPPQPGKE